MLTSYDAKNVYLFDHEKVIGVFVVKHINRSALGAMKSCLGLPRSWDEST